MSAADRRRSVMPRAVNGICPPVARLPRPTRPRTRVCTRHFRRPLPSDWQHSGTHWLGEHWRTRRITIGGQAQRVSSARGEIPRVRAETRSPVTQKRPRHLQTATQSTVGPPAARTLRPPGPQMPKRRRDSAVSAKTAPRQHSRTGRLAATPTPPRLAPTPTTQNTPPPTRTRDFEFRAKRADFIGFH